MFNIKSVAKLKLATPSLRGCFKSPLRGIRYFLPHPNPPRLLGRELDFPVSPLHKGGLRGVRMQLKSQPITFQTSS
jgi:hypothetical protein